MNSSGSTCQLCEQTLQRGKVLDCGHVFCHHCIQNRFINENSPENVTCPVEDCLHTTPLPSKIIADLQDVSNDAGDHGEQDEEELTQELLSKTTTLSVSDQRPTDVITQSAICTLPNSNGTVKANGSPDGQGIDNGSTIQLDENDNDVSTIPNANTIPASSSPSKGRSKLAKFRLLIKRKDKSRDKKKAMLLANGGVTINGTANGAGPSGVVVSETAADMEVHADQKQQQRRRQISLDQVRSNLQTPEQISAQRARQSQFNKQMSLPDQRAPPSPSSLLPATVASTSTGDSGSQRGSHPPLVRSQSAMLPDDNMAITTHKPTYKSTLKNDDQRAALERILQRTQIRPKEPKLEAVPEQPRPKSTGFISRTSKRRNPHGQPSHGHNIFQGGMGTFFLAAKQSEWEFRSRAEGPWGYQDFDHWDGRTWGEIID